MKLKRKWFRIIAGDDGCKGCVFDFPRRDILGVPGGCPVLWWRCGDTGLFVIAPNPPGDLVAATVAVRLGVVTEFEYEIQT